MVTNMFRYATGCLIGIALALIMFLWMLSFTDEVALLTAIQASAPVAILISAVIALCVYIENVKKNRGDKRRRVSGGHLDEAKQLLDRSYEVFTSGGTRPPKNSNRLWRTSAMLLLKAQATANNISEDDHKQTYSGHRQYYATRFHGLLWENENAMNLTYFVPSGNPEGTDTISRKAIAVIFQFAHSISSEYSELDGLDPAPIFASDSVPADFLGVENLIGQYQGLWERVQELKSANNGKGS